MTCTLDEPILAEDSSRIIADDNGADGKNGSIPLSQPNPSKEQQHGFCE
jgi:hypothetical protein